MSNSIGSWLTAFHTPGIAPRLSRLIRCFGSVAAAQAADEKTLLRCGLNRDLGELLRNPPGYARVAAEAAQHWASINDHHIITLLDPAYPVLLKQIDAPPPLLFIRGKRKALDLPQIAIVGSRNSTAYGRDVAGRLAEELGVAGLSICSGLATGIDSAAHRASVSADRPTVAVVGNGLDSVYPASNRRLAQAIVEHGALVSEFPLGSPPKSSHFPQRNRIISGMSTGVIVVEAALRSGSLITARLALEQNREVFAVPGSIRSSHSRGCHRLLRDGAILVESADDVLSALASLLSFQFESSAPSRSSSDADSPKVTSEERKVTRVMTTDPRPLDQLIVDTGIAMTDLLGLLLRLELKGVVQRCAGGYVLR